MVSLSKVLVALAAIAGVQVSATRYCQCENQSQSRIFPGIQEICNQLGSDWCATNCNNLPAIFGGPKNCDYCEFIPAGAGPDGPYQRLKSWCFSQTGYSNGVSYRGTEVICYSDRNKASCSTCGGCPYYNNGDFKLRERQDDPDAIAPSASVTLLQTVQDTGVAITEECTPIFPDAAQLIANDFVAEHPDCTSSGAGTNDVLITCSLESDPAGNTQAIVEDFKNACDSVGGGQTFDSADVPSEGLGRRADDVKLIFV
jgi:hypothetical protein